MEWEKPFEVPNLPPSFKGSGGGDGSGAAGVDGGAAAGGEAVDCSKMGDKDAELKGSNPVIYPIYNNRTHYTEPDRYPDRRFKVYNYPPVQDPEDEPVELKILSVLNETQTFIKKSDDGKTQLIFDRLNIPFDTALNKSSGGRETYEETIWS